MGCQWSGLYVIWGPSGLLDEPRTCTSVPILLSTHIFSFKIGRPLVTLAPQSPLTFSNILCLHFLHMSVNSITVLDFCLAALAVYIVRSLFHPRQPAPLPPGPKGLPLLGNVLDMPTEKEWLTFAEWGEAWGIYITLYKSIELNARSI
jgi:hypothetical protein